MEDWKNSTHPQREEIWQKTSLVLQTYFNLLPLVSKIVEKAAQQQILEFMENTKPFNSNNNANRKYFNTATAIIQILDAVYEAIDENQIANILTNDESAAFDTISH